MTDSSTHVAREIARGNSWYTSNQIVNQRRGVYRHNMQLRYDYLHGHLARIAPNGATVVDLGCGDGQWSMELREHYDVRLVGIDYNPLRLQRYRQYVTGAEAQCASCNEIPVESHSVDFVMFHQVLEHLPDPERALREIHRILKPNGWLILSVPNEGTWLKLRVQYRWIEPYALQHTDHVNFFTKASLRSLLETCSFQVERLDTIGIYFPHNGLSRRLLDRKWSFSIGLTLAQVFPVLHDCLFAWCKPS